MSSFKDLRIVDNFYQTSSYYPMPTVMISTLAEDGSTSVGSYSLCFPYYIAGKSYNAMVLEARNSSNTAQHLLAGRHACRKDEEFRLYARGRPMHSGGSLHAAPQGGERGLPGHGVHLDERSGKRR